MLCLKRCSRCADRHPKCGETFSPEKVDTIFKIISVAMVKSMCYYILCTRFAEVVELADALDSGSSER